MGSPILPRPDGPFANGIIHSVDTEFGRLEEARKKIVFPLDFNLAAEAVSFAERLAGRVGMFKVGLELFVTAGPAIMDSLSTGAGIFLDLKFHDIPATVKGAARAAAGYKARFISVHAGGGRKMLEAAVEGSGTNTGVLAITALTSLDREDLSEIGLRDGLLDPSALVLHRAALAREAGCAGVVCSGNEAEAVKERFGGDFVVLVPGVRPAWAHIPGDDQARPATPAAVAAAGADYLVVGRPVRLADDPAGAVERIAEEISSAAP